MQKHLSRVLRFTFRTCTTHDSGMQTLNFLRWQVSVLVMGLWALLAPAAFAQTGGSGMLMIQLYGMVQVEPGSNVLTLGVKDEEIRFVVHDIYSSSRAFSTARFLSETKHRTPGLHVKGPEWMLDTLIKEKPSKRALKLSGLYYPGSRLFVLNGLEPFREEPRRDF